MFGQRDTVFVSNVLHDLDGFGLVLHELILESIEGPNQPFEFSDLCIVLDLFLFEFLFVSLELLVSDLQLHLFLLNIILLLLSFASFLIGLLEVEVDLA